MPISDLPALADFTTDNEVIVRPTPGQAPDSQGRIQFTAFWLSPASVYGVRGQVFRTSLEDFITREQTAGHPVRVEGGPRG